MNKVVWTAFKSVAAAIIFVIVWSVGFYLFRAYNLNQRIEAVMVTMQQEVSKNNYLTEDAYHMYENIFLDIQETMNNGGTFVEGFNINYGEDSNYIPVDRGHSSLVYSTDLQTPANYGDIAVLEVQVGIVPVIWFYDTTQNGAANQVQMRDDPGVIILTYTYQVPCMRYVSVTD